MKKMLLALDFAYNASQYHKSLSLIANLKPEKNWKQFDEYCRRRAQRMCLHYF